MLDDLLTDFVEQSSSAAAPAPQNAYIVKKSVNILKIISEFVSSEKKK
jgi:hypothetical protein